MVWWTLLLAAGVFEDGLRLSGEGKWAEARIKFAEVVQLDPKNALAWKALGVTAGKLGDPIEAEEALSRGCQLDRKLADVCFYHARSLYTLNRFEAALHVLTTEPRTGRSLVAMGQAFEALGREKEAETAFREALTKSDALDEARLRMGIFLFRAGRLAEAEKVLVEAVGGRPSFGEAMGELGRVYYQTGRMQHAVLILEKASRLRPDLEWVGLLLERAKQRL
jgi:protein O-GlcNAc transferase